MSHADETITDLQVRRLSVATGAAYVAFGWDYPGATLLEVRIVRSPNAFAKQPDDPARPVGQHIAYQGTAGSYRDADVTTGGRYYYTIYARHPGELDWTLWEKLKVTVGSGAGARVAGAPAGPGLAGWRARAQRLRAGVRRLLR
jgi:hypothetical protein